MDRNVFWKIINESREAASDIEELTSVLVNNLKSYEADEIISFAQNMNDLLGEMYRWDLWAVGYIVNGGCSDDGFEYFRGWLIAQGSERCNAVMADPSTIIDWAVDDDENECEELLYAAGEAYEEVAGEDFPYDAIQRKHPSDPIGEAWDEHQLEAMFPHLYKRFF